MQHPLSEEEQESYKVKFDTYDTEIENGIFNMVVTLCHHKAQTVGMDKAKQEVSNWLERIVSGLREEIKDNIQEYMKEE